MEKQIQLCTQHQYSVIAIYSHGKNVTVSDQEVLVCQCHLSVVKLSHMCVCGVEGWDHRMVDGVGPMACGKGAVEPYYGTEVVGSSHPCIKGCHSN
jgi:hypothetical protein